MHSFNIWRSIERLRCDFDIDINLILDGTSVQRGSDINAFELMRIARNLKIDGKSLLNGDFDLQRTAKILGGNKLSIPNKYELGMFSSSTSLKNLVNQFSRFGMKNYVLNKIQVDESFMHNHRPLSVNAVNDALYLVKDFISIEDLKNYSKANARDFLTKSYGQVVQQETSKEKVVEAMLSVAHYVERNWDYKIISNDSGNYTIESEQSEQMLDHSPKKIYTNSYINEMRTYFFYYFMELCGFKNHDVQITSQEFNINSKMTFKVITRGASFTPQASSGPKFH